VGSLRGTALSQSLLGLTNCAATGSLGPKKTVERIPSTAVEALPAQQLASLKCLEELALELRISWDHSTDDIWRELDPELWELTRNPTLVLHATSKTKLDGLAADTEYRRRLEDFVLARRLYARSPGWFQFAHPGAPLNHVAYFSMEFGVSEALPIYSGGLGNVAGDQLLP